MNYSKQREAIMTVLCSTTCHPTAEWVYNEVKKVIPNISLGTVYRNLKQLEENGDIIRVHGTFEKDHYDGNPINHAHFVCTVCGEVSDLPIPPNLAKAVMELSLNASDFTLGYQGVCAKCKNAGLDKKPNLE